ncbi:MAG: 16S rRNA (adenine(1518)-N(6)/adenine(1519)-N(6))-dimethyltransferase RsmA [Syntrophomonadaceae bacterium]|jgi:16S rRNA (adenine1518-N6/adenine1519-N6)-dimethyltransferase
MTSAATLSGVKYLMARYQLYPKKRLGQNFLIDRNILTKIADSCELNPQQDLVVEIGPGMGALTAELAIRSRGVLAIDVDSSLETLLNESLSEHKNTRFLFADILKIDLEQELKNSFHMQEIEAYKVCANIPYNITTPIIFKLLETCSHLQSAVLMMQKEVAARLLALPGSKDYGLLTIMAAYYSRVEHIMNVSRNCFYPRPEVDSTVVRIIPCEQRRVTVKNETIFKNLIRASFQRRRKTILNIFSDFFGVEKNDMAKQLQHLGISHQKRPENLTIEEFACIANIFTP